MKLKTNIKPKHNLNKLQNINLTINKILTIHIVTLFWFRSIMKVYNITELKTSSTTIMGENRQAIKTDNL